MMMPQQKAIAVSTVTATGVVRDSARVVLATGAGVARELRCSANPDTEGVCLCSSELKAG